MAGLSFSRRQNHPHGAPACGLASHSESLGSEECPKGDKHKRVSQEKEEEAAWLFSQRITYKVTSTVLDW